MEIMEEMFQKKSIIILKRVEKFLFYSNKFLQKKRNRTNDKLGNIALAPWHTGTETSSQTTPAPLPSSTHRLNDTVSDDVIFDDVTSTPPIVYPSLQVNRHRLRYLFESKHSTTPFSNTKAEKLGSSQTGYEFIKLHVVLPPSRLHVAFVLHPSERHSCFSHLTLICLVVPLHVNVMLFCKCLITVLLRHSTSQTFVTSSQVTDPGPVTDDVIV